MILPDMNGPEVAQELTRISPDLAILFLSGYSAKTSNSMALSKDTFANRYIRQIW